MDQCMSGATDTQGLLAKRPTVWTANSKTLLTPFRKYRCDGRHLHGHPTEEESTEHYPAELCNTIIDGIVALKEERQRHPEAFPTTETSIGTNGDAYPPRPPPGGMGCPSCHSGVRRDSPTHTRKRGTCRWYDIAPRHWECKACNIDKKKKDQGHDPYRHKPGACRL